MFKAFVFVFCAIGASGLRVKPSDPPPTKHAKSVKQCMVCDKKFPSFMAKKHICNCCGAVCCSTCASQKMVTEWHKPRSDGDWALNGGKEEKRVCYECKANKGKSQDRQPEVSSSSRQPQAIRPPASSGQSVHFGNNEHVYELNTIDFQPAVGVRCQINDVSQLPPSAHGWKGLVGKIMKQDASGKWFVVIDKAQPVLPGEELKVGQTIPASFKRDTNGHLVALISGRRLAAPPAATPSIQIEEYNDINTLPSGQEPQIQGPVDFAETPTTKEWDDRRGVFVVKGPGHSIEPGMVL